MMKTVVFLIFLFLFCAEISLTLRIGNGETQPKDGMFLQIDRDMNEPPYSIINVYYTESIMNEDLLKEIENNRKIEQNKMKNYFRKNLTGNKYFMDYSKKQREQMEILLDLMG
ncbi:conserved Plasmodium protein, unknown function [Plasmodium knowlesi strain H]|uniref:LIMP protein n=3 Tax=Plasmodium knowlesi TaxID=5850 RepID=A0A5K1VCA6_PLAKH|nr:LIMP protein, putative [Plasmodium knowlesi strain H]OTN66660.1 Uncharacterized protein PKNOH_S08478700 [Plasmodium knowlesi]CAA9990111.1 LIMP protein, putative [Plasmodium knowlesi strain H]SBO25789.1 conserved Plasmodium protein, unknown function [Plasmodium knowlesi strain H]SBO28584.1 conserved Plasmodium protein, unknown function [Plasmodium knowlesi strain H]VVS79585.1 LIMP protein, putative [Plasmodium knowlesi strain H]|eukprot:XP_002260578.1 hypothetical protein, conserved in Plasmodium species [Plasmodium knowlesi strain H]